MPPPACPHLRGGGRGQEEVGLHEGRPGNTLLILILILILIFNLILDLILIHILDLHLNYTSTQALRDFHSPLQLRKKIQRNCSRLGLSEGLRSVTGHATARVQRITRWVFTLNFAKIFVPLLLAAFLTALHPHTEIQVCNRQLKVFM